MNIAEVSVQNNDMLTAPMYSDLTQMIGNTPMIRFRSIEPRPGVEIYGKAEWVNPGGSVKDRPALAMIEHGERTGKLTKDKILIDATSGNTGIAYAMICASRGYRVRLFMQATASQERKHILRALGAELILTDPAEGYDGTIYAVREEYARDPDRFFYPDQYENPENWRAHFRTTGVEIYHQTSGKVSHFIAGLGTTGTFVGTARRLKAYDPAIQAISFQPDSALHGLEGLKHMESAIVPGIYDTDLADHNTEVSSEAAFAMVRQVARDEGILIGISSGAALVAAGRVATDLNEGIIVVILADSGNRYLSDELLWETN